MRAPSWLAWTLLALLGLAVAAGISVAASHLVSQRIGSASEPLSAGKELAPPQPESRTTAPWTGLPRHESGNDYDDHNDRTAGDDSAIGNHRAAGDDRSGITAGLHVAARISRPHRRAPGWRRLSQAPRLTGAALR